MVLFGTPEQQTASWLPKLATGEWISAFALTEPEAGSDAANVQTHGHAHARRQGLRAQRPKALDHQRRHRPGADRDGPHAGARRQGRRKITAFLVTPDMPGFEVVEARMPKCGVRGTATVAAGVPRHVRAQGEHPGRAGQGAARGADGARLRPHHVRRQLHRRGEVLRRRGPRATPPRACSSASRSANFELVKEKLAYMQAGAFAMEAATYKRPR